jgi:hypothetical protein
MALKGYFDGSGKTANGDTVICLGGVSAPVGLWPSFARAWGQVLAELPELESSWHTTDALRVLGPKRFYEAAARLLSVIHDFRESDAPSPLITYSATVSLAGYERARQQIPNLRPLEAICVNAVIGRIVVPTEDDFPILLYFDRSEEFMKHVERVWRYARRNKRKSRGWPWQVAKISRIQSDGPHDSYPLQAADLVSWAVRRHRKYALDNPGVPPRGGDAWDMTLTAWAIISARHVGSDHNYDSIVKAYPNG